MKIHILKLIKGGDIYISGLNKLHGTIEKVIDELYGECNFEWDGNSEYGLEFFISYKLQEEFKKLKKDGLEYYVFLEYPFEFNERSRVDIAILNKDSCDRIMKKLKEYTQRKYVAGKPIESALLNELRKNMQEVFRSSADALIEIKCHGDPHYKKEAKGRNSDYISKIWGDKTNTLKTDFNRLKGRKTPSGEDALGYLIYCDGSTGLKEETCEIRERIFKDFFIEDKNSKIKAYLFAKYCKLSLQVGDVNSKCVGLKASDLFP